MRVRFTLHDWQGHMLGELAGMSQRAITWGRNQTPVLTFTAKFPADPQLRERARMYAELMTDYRIVAVWLDQLPFGYPECQLIFAGPVVGVDETVTPTAASAAIVCAGPYWRLTTRIADLAPGSVLGGPGGANVGSGRRVNGISMDDGYDNAKLAAVLVTDSITLDGNHWCRADPAAQSAGGTIRLIDYGGYSLVSDTFDYLSQLTAGFDYSFDPAQGVDASGAPALVSDANGLVLATMRSAASLTRDQSDAIVFDLGGGLNNLATIERVSALDSMATRVTDVESGSGAQYAVTDQAPASIAAIGVFEAITQAQLIDVGLRRSLVDLNLAIRRTPRVQVTITPKAYPLSRPPVGMIPMLDIQPCDLFSVRAWWPDGSLRMDGQMRVETLGIDIDDNDVLTPVIGTVRQDASTTETPS